MAAQDVLRGGMDANTFLHALRRRWLLASCMGLVAGQHRGHRSVDYFSRSRRRRRRCSEVESEQQSLVFDVDRQPLSGSRFSRRRKWQLLKSYFVLQSAVRNPGRVAGVFAGRAIRCSGCRRICRSTSRSKARFLSISLSGDDSTVDQNWRVVDAVATAYENEVVAAETQVADW